MLREGLTKYHLQRTSPQIEARHEQEGPEIAATQPQPGHHRLADLGAPRSGAPVAMQRKGKKI